MNRTLKALAPLTILLISGLTSIPVVRAQSGRICDIGSDFEPAAETQRTVELSEFKIAVSIPENYRTMKFQDGSVQILHPNTFNWLQCLASGGSGAHGYYSESIEQVAPDPTMSVQEQLAWTMGYAINADGSRTPTATGVVPYQQNGLDGYIASSPTSYSATFLGRVPDSTQLLQVSVGCDCEVDVESLLELLSNIRPSP